MDFLNPFQVDDGHHTNLQVHMAREVDLIGFDATVQTFIEQEIRVHSGVLPSGERACGLTIRGGLFVVVQVIAFAAAAHFTIGAKLLFQLLPFIGLGTEMAEVPALLLRFGHAGLHFHAVVSMKRIAFNHRRVDTLTAKDGVKGALDRGGARTAGAGDHDDGMFFGHGNAFQA